MTTSMHFGTAAVHLGEAIRFFAYIFESRNYARRGSTFDHFVAEPAFACIFVLLRILACLANVVGGTVADGAEVLGTITASDSEWRHVLSCLFRNWVAHVIFLLVVGFAWFDWKDGATFTANHLRVVGDSRIHLLIFDPGHEFTADKPPDLIPINCLPALGTPCLLKLDFLAFLRFWHDQFSFRVFRKARDVELVVAFSAQKHINSVLLPILLNYFFLAKETLITFFFEIHSVVFIFLVNILMVLNYWLYHNLNWLNIRLPGVLLGKCLVGFSTAPSVRATKNVAARLCFRPLQHLLDRGLGFWLIHKGL